MNQQFEKMGVVEMLQYIYSQVGLGSFEWKEVRKIPQSRLRKLMQDRYLARERQSGYDIKTRQYVNCVYRLNTESVTVMHAIDGLEGDKNE